MKLEIKPGFTVGQIKQNFALHYPFLKLEISTCKKANGHCASKCIATDEKMLSDMRPGLSAGVINADENQSVTELEVNFREQFLLNVQVYRRSGKLWLETATTDCWTLKQQNEHAKYSCGNKNPAEKLETDYELSRDPD